MFCQECGNQIPDRAVMCVHCGVATGKGNITTGAKSRVGYVLLGLFLGVLGIHNFYAGYVGRGIAQLLISIFIGWLIIPLIAVIIWVIVEICTVSQDAKSVAFT